MGCDDYGDTTSGTGAPGYMKREPEDSMEIHTAERKLTKAESMAIYGKIVPERTKNVLCDPKTCKDISHAQVHAMAEADERRAYHDEKADHVLAAARGGVNRSSVANITHSASQGCGATHPGFLIDCTLCLPPVSSGDMYKPHTYKPSAAGLIGAPCLMCGGPSQAPQHDPKPLPEGEIRVQSIVDTVAGNVIRIEVDNPPTQEARDILTNILPGVLEDWLHKNKDYGDSDELKCLGAKAEFVRLWNKMMKLKTGLWEGRELSGEQVPEIMSDMIAHLLLALSRSEE